MIWIGNPGYATTDVAGSSQSVRFSSLRPNPLHRTQTNMVDPNGIFPRIATDPISRRSCSKAGHLKSTATVNSSDLIELKCESTNIHLCLRLHLPGISNLWLTLFWWTTLSHIFQKFREIVSDSLSGSDLQTKERYYDNAFSMKDVISFISNISS